MRMHASIVVILVAVLSGCAVSSPRPDNALTRADLRNFERSQEELAAEVQRLRDNVLLVEARVQDQQQLIEQMRTSIAALKVTPAGEIAEPAPMAPTAAADDGRSPTEIYLQAFSDYTSGRYRQGAAGFETFISRFPENEYVGNARFWLGESYLALQQHERAAQEFARLVEDYPQGDKAPEALLKMATALLKMDQPDRAAQALEILFARYPNSPAARKARQGDTFSTILPNGRMP